jgi:hypothetical protein
MKSRGGCSLGICWTDLIVSQKPLSGLAGPAAKCRSSCAAILDSAFPLLADRVIGRIY